MTQGRWEGSFAAVRYDGGSRVHQYEGQIDRYQQLSLAGDDPRGALQTALTLVEEAQQATGAGRDARVAAALAAIDRQADPADAAWLRAPLATKPPDLARARSRLEAALDALSPPEAAVDSSDARARLGEVLADPRFHPRTLLDLVPGFLLPLAIFVVDLANVIASIVRWPFDRLFDLLGDFVDSQFFRPAMAIGAIGVVGGLVLLYRRGLRAALIAQAEAAAQPLALPPTSAEALAAAREKAQIGDYRAACHFVFLSTLLAIEERGVAHFDRSATNREHLARLAREPAGSAAELGRALAPIVARFDRLWYGQATVTAADYQDLLALAEQIQMVAV
jgi:hypothetical protein